MPAKRSLHPTGESDKDTSFGVVEACGGHPIGVSGARCLVTLLNALRVRGEKTGIVSLCFGGGEAVGMAVELL